MSIYIISNEAWILAKSDRFLTWNHDLSLSKIGKIMTMLSETRKIMVIFLDSNHTNYDENMKIRRFLFWKTNVRFMKSFLSPCLLVFALEDTPSSLWTNVPYGLHRQSGDIAVTPRFGPPNYPKIGKIVVGGIFMHRCAWKKMQNRVGGEEEKLIEICFHRKFQILSSANNS